MPVAHFLLFYIVDEQKKQFLFYVSCIVNGISINKYKWNFVTKNIIFIEIKFYIYYNKQRRRNGKKYNVSYAH